MKLANPYDAFSLLLQMERGLTSGETTEQIEQEPYKPRTGFGCNVGPRRKRQKSPVGFAAARSELSPRHPLPESLLAPPRSGAALGSTARPLPAGKSTRPSLDPARGFGVWVDRLAARVGNSRPGSFRVQSSLLVKQLEDNEGS